MNDGDYLIEDPRKSDWRTVIQEVIGSDKLNEIFDTLEPDQSAISEEMNVAYAMHELTAQCKPEIMKFIDTVEKHKPIG